MTLAFDVSDIARDYPPAYVIRSGADVAVPTDPEIASSGVDGCSTPGEPEEPDRAAEAGAMNPYLAPPLVRMPLKTFRDDGGGAATGGAAQRAY